MTGVVVVYVMHLKTLSAIPRPEVLTKLVTHITMQSKQQQTEKKYFKDKHKIPFLAMFH